MKTTEPPNQEEFDALLGWLDPDRERAGAILYEEIRPKLIKVLVRRQCYVAEELADETTNRVSHKVKDIAPTYEGNPALYFYGVLRNVWHEWLRSDPPDPPPPDPRSLLPDPIEDPIYDCLDKCLQELDPEDRELILKYHEKEKRAKIEHRNQLAEERGITLNSLRMRVHRISGTLEKCIVDCLNNAGANEAGDVLAG